MFVVLVLMLTLTFVSAVPAYGASVAIDATNFPDDVFRDYVKKNFDKNHNDMLEEAEIDEAKDILLNIFDIKNLKGIEHFKKLEQLYCNFSELISLDLSKNTELRSLSVNNDNLTELDLSKNTKLEELQCNNNKLNSIDLSKNTELRELRCSNNKLNSIDLSKNTGLMYLICSNNKLNSIDLSNNIELVYFICSNNKLTSIDLSKNTGLEDLNCNNNKLTSIDLSSNTKLKRLDCYNNKLTSLDLSNNKNVNYGDFSGQVYEVMSDEVKFADLPAGFNKEKVMHVEGGDIGEEGFNITGDSLTYRYNTDSLSSLGEPKYLVTTLKKVDGYRITVSDDGNGSGTANPAKAVEGQEIVLTSNANTGYVFKEWQVISPVGLNITGNKFNMPDENVEVKAIFNKVNPETPPSGGIPGEVPDETEKLKKAKETAANAVDELLNIQTFSGEELKKAEDIKKEFKEKLEKAKNVEEIKKLQEETLSKLDALWSDEELTLKAKVKAIGKAKLKIKSKLVKTKKGIKAVKINWKKIDGFDFDGYEIYKSTSKTKFGNKPIVTTKGTKRSCLNKKNLKKGKIYYYKIKAFKVINGEKVYTGWSNRTWKKTKK